VHQGDMRHPPWARVRGAGVQRCVDEATGDAPQRQTEFEALPSYAIGQKVFRMARIELRFDEFRGGEFRARVRAVALVLQELIYPLQVQGTDCG
jgi:hypothetical protein